MNRRINTDNGDNKPMPSNPSITIGTLTNRDLMDAKINDRETDAFYKIAQKLEHSKVSIPTEDAVIEAKEWVDNVSRM